MGGIINMHIIKKIVKKIYLVLVLLFTILIFGLLSKNFLTTNNLVNIFVQNSWVIVVSIGVAMIMISGGADLSVSNQMSIVSVVIAMLMVNYNFPVWLAILIGLFIGMLLGFINGTCTNKLKVHPMVVTLATMTVYQGIAYLISQSKSFFNLPAGFKAIGQSYVFGIPVAVIIMFFMVAIAILVLNKTYFGRYIYAIGGNAEAARLAGINVSLVRILTFILAGFFVGVSTIILTARTGSANAAIAPDAVFNSITACVLGGISFKGGSGKVSNVVISVLIIGVLANGMQLIGMGIYPQYIVKGIILIAAIAFDNYQNSSKAKITQTSDKSESVKTA